MFTNDEILKIIDQAIEISLKKFKLGCYLEAELVLEQALKTFPEETRIIQLLGIVKHSMEKFKEAIEIFKKAIEFMPDDSENYNNLGLCYSNEGNYLEAIKALKKAIKINPSCAYIHSNLGLQYRNINNLELAIKSFKKSLSIKESDLTWGMLGGCYGEKRNLIKAEECFKKSIEINPNFAGGHVDLANVYHLKGEWDKAWEEYEWRYDVFEQLKVWKELYDPDKKWKGQSLENKTIMIHGEQGHGDTIQFFRYVKHLKNANVILHCSEDLISIFSHHVNEVFTKEPTEIKREQLPVHDYHCSILSLPYILNVKEVPNFSLKIENKINLDLYSDLLKIGIVWAGNPQHPNDSNRSCHLNNFNEIHNISGIKLFSLVKDTRPRLYRFNKTPIDLTEDTEEMKIVDMSSMMNTFGDTAVIINSLDLIITVDTSVLHLAGSMEKKVWAILPFNSDWRWGSKEKTIWYPNVRIFRQPSKGDWKSVFSNIKKEIYNEYRLR